MTRVISHGRISLYSLKLQLQLVKIVNSDSRVVYDPDMPRNSIMITEEEDE